LIKMLKFERDQKIFEIGGIHIGGQPGELATVLIGTIFYEGHKIVEDAERGIFDKGKTEELIKRQEELSGKTGNPHMIDIVGSTPAAIQKYIEFVANVTDAPIFIDSTFTDVKLAGVKYAAEIGLLDRTVYNSLTYHVNTEEIEALKDVGVKSTVILGYNPKNVRPIGRIELLRGSSSREGLLKTAEEAGIKNILVDTAVLDVPSIGWAAEAVYLVKNEFGLPSGGGPSNAVLEWKRINELGNNAKNVCMANAAVAMQQAGANFILYGPIGKADAIFPAVAMTDAITAYTARLGGTKPKMKEHPLYKIF